MSPKSITVSTTRKDEVVDLTDEVEVYMSTGEQEAGVCIVFASPSPT